MTTLVVLNEPESHTELIRWGFRLSQAFEESVVFAVAVGAHQSKEEATQLEPVRVDAAEAWKSFAVGSSADEENSVEESNVEEGDPHESPYEVVAIESTFDPSEILEIVKERKAKRILVPKRTKKRENRDQSLVRNLFDTAPCMVIVLRPGLQSSTELRRIMVPIGGGPHGNVALKFAMGISEQLDTEIVPLFVDVVSGEDSEVADRRLDRMLSRQGIRPGDKVLPQTVLSSDVSEGVNKACDEQVDLLLLGESNVGIIRRTLFGTIPDRLMAQASNTAVAVVRRPWSFMDRARERIERFLDLTIPQLQREDRVALFDRLQSGSAWSFDFMALIALSTTIAGLGLLQDSAAVVIGAMLVAPLMTPLLGAGLALVQGNLPLLIKAAQAIILGFLSALCIGVVLGFLVPVSQLTPQLLARGAPTVLDLVIGFLSGVAAAYCSGRPNLSAALPGVAIAAALVPPVATIGISIALGEEATARGAATLFGINVVAIVVGAAAALYGGGVRPVKSSAVQPWRRVTLLGLIFLLVTLAVPLSSWLLSDLRSQFHRGFSPQARKLVDTRVQALTAASIQDFAAKQDEDELHLRLVLRAASPPTRDWAQALKVELEQLLETKVDLRVNTQLTLEVK